MPRKPCKRHISGCTVATLFLPEARRASQVESVDIMPDEFEALRLADLHGLYQEEAAARMRISRATFSRIVTAARAKVADALVNGKAIRLAPFPHTHSSQVDVMSDAVTQSQGIEQEPSVAAEPRSAGQLVCIPIAMDHGMESKLMPHFGSAPMFAIVDTAQRTMRVLGNAHDHGHAHGQGHGGCAPVEPLAALGVDAVIVGGIGAGAIRRLSAYGIRVFEGHPGPVSALIDEYTAGLLGEWDPGHACAGHDHHGHDNHGHSDGHHHHQN
jgi:predicted DNA-binding protein (UPF0251 family)/predicted Fe-Mo cluster-binding NifX family protein